MLKLVCPDKKYEKQYKDMMDEWYTVGEKIIPYSIRRLDYKNFDEYLYGFEEEKNGCLYGGVPATTLWAYDAQRDIIVGTVNIRHWLNEELLKDGGHIGDGIRHSERRKGYATKIIALALEECKKLNIDRVLMVCYKDNIGSAKSIINNGGILENEIMYEDGTIDQRYWIELGVQSKKDSLNEKEINFLCRAKKSTYAGKGAEVISSRPNSHDLQYGENNLKYIDTYLGGEKFIGEEAVWRDNSPYWSMNYMGRIIAEGFSGNFLKECLLLVPKEYPYRGPLVYQNGDYKYHCKVNGEFQWFNGYEEIFYNDIKVYECIFHGGCIK